MRDLGTEGRNWIDFTGSVCESCGKHREMKYIFPVLIQIRKKFKRMVPLCLECIAASKYPEGMNQKDLPWYDPRGNRLNKQEKINVFMG